MNDTKPFTMQNVVFVILFAAFIGAIWLTTQPQENVAKRATKNMALSANALPALKITRPHQH
jgi:cytochrome bd-type quinol oxidase subunit 2